MTRGFPELKAEIVRRGLNQFDVGLEAGYTETAFSKLMTGARKAPPEFTDLVLAVIKRLTPAEAAA